MRSRRDMIHDFPRNTKLQRRSAAIYPIQRYLTISQHIFFWLACMNDVLVRCFDRELPPAAMTSARAVFPEPRAPIIATRPLFSSITELRNQGAFFKLIDLIVCDAREALGGLDTTSTQGSGSMQICLSVSKQRSPLIQV